MDNLMKQARNLKEEVKNIRQWLHMHPELSNEEIETSKYIQRHLEELNIKYEIFATTGVCGIIKGKKEDNGKVIALRADIDALPIEDKKNCSYSSKKIGKMHACGHDGHIAILLGVAKVLSNNKDKFGGKVKLIFEPAEETIGGARFMIDEGVLENPKVDVVAGLHMDENLETGKVKVRRGVVNAASNPFRVKIIGSGGHGAYPANTVDPIVIASNIILSLQTIVSREIDPMNPIVITIGSINGGTAQNIIPEFVEFSGIIRTMTREDREFAVRRFREIIEGICLASRAKAIIDIEESYPNLYNDDEMVKIFKQATSKVIGKENVVEQINPKMGVESFAYFAEKVPGVFYFLGCRNEEKGIVHPAHNGLFDLDEEALPIGVAIQSQIVIEYLTSDKNNINLI